MCMCARYCTGGYESCFLWCIIWLLTLTVAPTLKELALNPSATLLREVLGMCQLLRWSASQKRVTKLVPLSHQQMASAASPSDKV